MTSTSPPAPAPPAPALTAATTTTITDDQHVEIWKHLFENVIRYKIDEDLYNLLQKNGVTDVIELMTEFAANEDDMAKWNYKREKGPDKGTKYNISKKNVADVLALQDYIYNVAAKLLLATPAQMTFTQFMSLNRQDFAIMRTDPQYKKNRTVTFNAPDPALTNTNAGSSAGTGGGGAASNGGNNFNNFTEPQLFKKSIKRDPAQFPQLKSDSGFDSWRRGTEIQAKVQDVEEVLDANYTANTDDEKELFELKQNYMYSVFEKNLLTNKGKRIVRQHQGNSDAQKVYAEICDHHTNSINAQNSANDINQYIVTTRIDDNKWNGTTHDYVIFWQEQVRLYHSLTPATSHYNENTLMEMLHRAVEPNQDLRVVFQQCRQLSLLGKTTFDYDNYTTLLLGACTTYDNSISKKGVKAVKPQRNIYSTEFDDISGVTDTPSIAYEAYNIDTALSTIETNYHNRQRGTSMTRDQWNRIEKIDKKYQNMWDEFPTVAQFYCGTGHLTDVPLESVYSGVVSLRGLRMLLFLAELNDLETWVTDIGNAYLEAVTEELLVIIAGPEFGEREGHMLIIYKALYGLRSSGLRWHQRFSSVLKSEGFMPCKMEPDIWMRERDKVYEYIAVYVDDLAFAMHDPKEFTSKLIEEHGFKLKGTGPIEYHLGCDFTRDEDGTMCMRPKKYIDRMVDGYKRMFGEKSSRRVKSPLEENDHPELDDSELLGPDGVSKYQSLVGSMQWAISLGRFDIATACMTLSSFRSCPRKGHLERAKRVVSYLSNMSDATIRFRTIQPDFSDLPGFEYDWDATIYGDVREEVPKDAPTPLGRAVTLSHFVDANLYHDMLTGRSVTGILHLMNQTPIDWHAKKQGKVETATYGSEFMAARTTVEQIEDLRITLRYLGVPIHHKSYLFGDNEAVVNSASRIDARLHKRHNALSFHRVREAIASRMVDFHHIPGACNPADILSKHWAYGKVWNLLQPLMFWSGDTADIEEYKQLKIKGKENGSTVKASNE